MESVGKSGRGEERIVKWKKESKKNIAERQI